MKNQVMETVKKRYDDVVGPFIGSSKSADADTLSDKFGEDDGKDIAEDKKRQLLKTTKGKAAKALWAGWSGFKPMNGCPKMVFDKLGGDASPTCDEITQPHAAALIEAKAFVATNMTFQACLRDLGTTDERHRLVKHAIAEATPLLDKSPLDSTLLHGSLRRWLKELKVESADKA